jgi:hypothetical protein
MNDNNNRIAQGIDTEVHITHGEETVQNKPKFLFRDNLIALRISSLDFLQREVLEAGLQTRGFLCELKH